MSDTTVNSGPGDEVESRRDFLYLVAGTTSAVGLGAAIWPLIDSMNPAADTLAVASVEVNLAPIQLGQRITVKWRGKPIFIVRRSKEAIRAAQADDDNPGLIDPEHDVDRVQRLDWLVVVGICTHLGCVPVGQKVYESRGNWGGWFCPCHGSYYDTSGRIRKGPAPRNLEVPPYRFQQNDIIRLG